MTREEAIANLKELLECNYVDSFEDAENEALEIAIKALKQNESAEEWYRLFVEKLEQEPKTIPISVIDDIKADIYALIDDTDSIYGTSALHKALDIIDKHISGKAESEE